MAWTNEKNPFGANRTPVLIGLSSANDGAVVPVAVDPVTGRVLTSAVNTGSVTLSGNANANMFTGQVTVNTTQVQLSGANNTLSNGVIIKALSTNISPISVGLTGVTATTGDLLAPGDARGYAVSNTNLLYIISGTSTTDSVSYSAN